MGHRRFEEMCALAITGQLGGAQMCELDEHIAICERCRKYLESVAQVSVQAMPLLADKHGSEPKILPAAWNARTLPCATCLRNERRRKRQSVAPIPNAARKRSFHFARGCQDRRSRNSIVASNLEGGVFFYLWRFVRRRERLRGCCGGRVLRGHAQNGIDAFAIDSNAPTGFDCARGPATTPKPNDSDRLTELERQKSELETKLVSMKQELATAESERESLSNELASAKEKLATLTTQTANRSAQDSPAVSQQAGEQVATLQAQVDRLGQRLAEEEVSLDVQKQTSKELSAKLDSTSSDLQRERDLKSAKSELGDLVAARNLHIVDVYDADGNGRRQQSFGRVFYIEGKSLVFYAYDLDDPSRFKTNVVFHVWGGKAGMKEVTHSLGILHKDDAGQNRWAMTFDDPSVLAQINSVFVTAESANKHYDEPHGKKVLYAYFGSQPNHP